MIVSDFMEDVPSVLQTQIDSIKGVVIGALEYHFANYKEHEKWGGPNADIRQFPGKWQRSQGLVKYELMAYLTQLRRIKYFIKNMQGKDLLRKPTKPELKMIWDDIMKRGGMVEMFANKWVVHRSIDDPRGEDEKLHAEVMYNLEGLITFWREEKMFACLRYHTLILDDYHPKVMAFLV